MSGLIENPLLLIPLLSGIIFFIAGIILKKYPPKEINHLYGYRTKRSMTSQETWDFSQQFAANQLMVFAVLLALLSLIGLFFKPNAGIATILAITLLLLICVLLILRVEKALKKKFGS